MLRLSLRPAFFFLMLIVLASCSGAGGCSGCSGCGMTPLASGFPQASVIDNAAAVRLTRPGLDFLSANLGGIAGDALGSSGGIITFNVPKSSSSFTIGTAYICGGGSLPTPTSTQCVADINVAGAKLNIDALAAVNGPNMEPALQITGTVPVKVADIPVDVQGPLGIDLGTIDVGVGTGGCNGSTPNVDYAPIPVTATLPIVDETIPPRNGYSMVDAANAQVNATIDSSYVQLCGGLLASIADAFKSYLVGQLVGPLTNTLKNQLQTQLCTKTNTMVTPPCPDGTLADGGDCVFQTATSTCVPTLLGLDGHMDLGSLVAKYSPGNASAVDLVFAANGAANPAPNCAPNQTYTNGACATDPNPPYSGHTPNGVTLSLLGGMLANPDATCVPIAPNPVPMGIPVPDELTTDKITPWPSGDNGPDINLALSQRFLTYAATSAYNSGVLCLGVSTAQFQALNSGYVSAVIPSLKDLTFEPGKSSKPEAMAITTRPQKPPVVVVSGNGTDIMKDPLLKITLPSFAIDFYVWSMDRYVRAFTYTADLTIPVDLETGKTASNPNDGIVPVIGDLAAANGTVTNSGLLWENPTNTASALSSLLGGIVGQFLGKGFSPINLNSSFAKYGIALSIPAGGFRKLTKGTDNFIGFFADLTTAPTGMVHHTQANIVGTEVHPEAMTLTGADRTKFPKLHVTLGSDEDDGSGQVEYSTWIDDQPRSGWSTSRDVTIDSQYLFLQGKHTLYAAGRFVGHPESEDETPAATPFIIDVLPPVVSLTTQDDGLVVSAYDYVSDDTALQVRWRANAQDGTQGPWTDWQGYAGLKPIPGGGSMSLEVQVEDEMGNVSDVNGLIRGRPDPTIPSASSACGCSTPGAPAGTQGALLAALAALGVVVLGRRRRASAKPTKMVTSPLFVVGSLAAVAATSQGCACGGNGNNQAQETTEAGMDCGVGCVQPCGPALEEGLIGEYTSVAVATDGTIWVAGYDDADVTNGLLYGDLVVGKYDTGKMKVQWATVDGLPAAPGDGDCAPNDPTGWRGGLTDPGPDVGLWTSIQLDSNNNPMVSYYDATNSALKFASSPDGGKTWNVHTVMQAANSDIGRYSKLLVLDGKPTVAFLVVEPGTGGWAKSRVVIATGNTATPMSASDWNMQDALVDPQTPCKAQFCSGGTVCVETSMQCQATVPGCKPSDCGASEAGIGATPQSCVDVPEAGASCQNTITSSYIDTYPDATGDYVAMANGPKGLGLVVYDRTRGNLVGVANVGGTWTSAILDGQIGSNSDPMRTDTGDDGIGASLAIDSNGDWHVSYVNGWTEALEYMHVPAGNLMKPLSPEVVDDGLHLNGMAYSDGQHIVGDDSSLTVDDSGNIRVVYQDATAGTLHEAVGTPATGNTHMWSVKAIQQQSTWFAGFFPHYVPQATQIANWYRNTDHSMSPPVVSGDVAFVSP
jgi:hypothetical protein